MARKIARREDRLFDKVFPQSLDSQIEQFAPQGMTDFQRRCTDISEVESKWRTHLSKISFPISFKSCQPSLNHGLMSLADCSGPPEMAPRQPLAHHPTNVWRRKERTITDSILPVSVRTLRNLFLHGQILFLAFACAFSAMRVPPPSLH